MRFLSGYLRRLGPLVATCVVLTSGCTLDFDQFETRNSQDASIRDANPDVRSPDTGPIDADSGPTLVDARDADTDDAGGPPTDTDDSGLPPKDTDDAGPPPDSTSPTDAQTDATPLSDTGDSGTDPDAQSNSSDAQTLPSPDLGIGDTDFLPPDILN